MRLALQLSVHSMSTSLSNALLHATARKWTRMPFTSHRYIPAYELFSSLHLSDPCPLMLVLYAMSPYRRLPLPCHSRPCFSFILHSSLLHLQFTHHHYIFDIRIAFLVPALASPRSIRLLCRMSCQHSFGSPAPLKASSLVIHIFSSSICRYLSIGFLSLSLVFLLLHFISLHLFLHHLFLLHL